MRWAVHVTLMGERSGVYMILAGKPEGKRSLGRPRRSWKDDIKMDLQEVGCGGVAWIELAQDGDWSVLTWHSSNSSVHTNYISYKHTHTHTHTYIIIYRESWVTSVDTAHRVTGGYRIPKDSKNTNCNQLI
jgi:hypothetical protein